MKKNNEIWYGLKTRTFSVRVSKQMSLNDIHDNLQDKLIRGVSMRSHTSLQKDRSGKPLLYGKNFFLNLLSASQNTIADGIPFELIAKHSEQNVRFYPVTSDTSFQYSKFILDATLQAETLGDFVIEITVHYDEPNC